MNYDQVIAGLNKDLQHTRKLENEAGPVQQMSAGATSALLQIAIQLAQLILVCLITRKKGLDAWILCPVCKEGATDAL